MRKQWERVASVSEFLRVAPGIDRWVMPQAQMNAVVVADGGEALVVDPGTLPGDLTAPITDTSLATRLGTTLGARVPLSQVRDAVRG